MPPIVTGVIVMIIGLNLAPVTIKSVSANSFDTWMAVLTIVCISVVAVFTRGMIRRLLLLIGLVAAYVMYFVLAKKQSDKRLALPDTPIHSLLMPFSILMKQSTSD